MVDDVLSTLSYNTPQVWEKTVTDVNDVDESFENARDLGYIRLNHARTGAVGKLSEYYDNQDIYKIELQSKGKLSLTFMTPTEDESPVDFSKYDDFYKELLKETDPEAYEELLAKEAEEDANKALLEYAAPGLKVEVYTTDKFGRQQLVADSSAAEGEDFRTNFDAMMNGTYQAETGTYHVKITRDETADVDDGDLSYVMNFAMGDEHKHDYISTEGMSQDSASKTETRMSAELMSYLGGTSAISVQAMANQGAADILSAGFLNFADMYNHNKD